MAIPVRVLIVDDSEDDALLMAQELWRGGFDPSYERVDTAPAMETALARQAWDIVLADHSMPAFSAPAALRLLRDSGHDTPFIIVSETINEEVASTATRARANDYLTKSQLTRLPMVVTRELRDARARRHAAEALGEMQARARAILTTAVDAIITINERGIIESVNPATERMFGYANDELIGANVSILMPAPEHDRHDDYVRNYLRTGERKIIGIGREVTARHKDGTTFPIDLAVSEILVGGRRLFTGMIRDLTARKRAERRLAVQHAVTRVLAASPSLAEASPRLLQAICEAVGWELGELWSVDGGEVLRLAAVWHTPALDAERFIALSRETTFRRGSGLPGHVWASGEAACIDDVADATCFLRHAAAAGLGLRGACAFPVRSGHTVLGVMLFLGRERRTLPPEWLETLDALGRQIGDFIERKRAEEALRQSEQRFGQFMRHLPGVAFMKDVTGRYVYVNDAFEQLFHRKLSAYIGQTDADVWPAPVAAQLRENDAQVMRDRVALQTTEMIPHDDGVHHWLVTKFPIFGAEGQPVMVGGIAIDVTQAKRAEAELQELQKLSQQRERMADIGAITAQIVHDLGNPLAGVSMQAQLILRRASRDSEQPLRTILKPAERIVAEVRRLDALIKEFMEFSREQRLDLRTVDVPRVLQDLVDLWRPVAAARSITLSFEPAQPVPPLRADEEKLRRVFDNLVKNAIEAIDRGPGQIRVWLGRASPEAIRVSVTDTGPGIPDDVQPFRLFETTKPDGTGLGLAVAKQIVLAHRGSIDFARLVPRGTVFHVDLPSDGPLP